MMPFKKFFRGFRSQKQCVLLGCFFLLSFQDGCYFYDAAQYNKLYSLEVQVCPSLHLFQGLLGARLALDEVQQKVQEGPVVLVAPVDLEDPGGSPKLQFISDTFI